VKLTSLRDLHDLPFDQIIDVRSPAEFALDHIPGAINLPVLDDAERAEVGYLYVRKDRFQARKIGAALVARNTAVHLQGALADKPGGWRPLVYCWRGGQRSGAFATILGQIGWRAGLIDGGYQSYRRLVARRLYGTNPTPAPDHDFGPDVGPSAERAPGPEVIVISGGTGTGKTAVLGALRGRGAQVIDLEALAQHRGSVFGREPGGQPSQKMFESQLAAQLERLSPARPVFVEDESNKIGKLRIPPALWRRMIAAPRLILKAPVQARADFLTRSYAQLRGDLAHLAMLIDTLRPYHPKDRITAWHQWAAQGHFEPLAAALIEQHYDPRYAKAQQGKTIRAQLWLPDMAPSSIEHAAEEILAALRAL
jgi:tRNA 2-selenouridine synthase